MSERHGIIWVGLNTAIGNSLHQEDDASATDGTRSSTTEGAKPERLQWRKLDDLAPHYIPAVHSSYLRAVLEGIGSHGATNIALSGPYGSGKSSILQGLVQRYPSQSIPVSLATVRASGEKAPSVTASVNDLQKEIVKQILYVVDPAKVPASRFPRTSKFQWSRSLRWSLLTGVAGVAVQWLIALIVAFAQQDSNLIWRPEIYAPTLIGVAVITFVLLRVTNGRLSVSDLTAGPAKLTLSDKSGSYFDDYLDEIVYFFQVSKKRILILEDMDRFNNVEVFEDLRALNVLLNHSAQLKPHQLYGKASFWNRLLKRRPWAEGERLDLENLSDLEAVPAGFYDGPIVFVYAIRDSLLAETVVATDDVRHDAFTRTKFFDLIVPVVPFVTAQNARGALKKELDLLVGQESADPKRMQARPSNDLVRTIAQYFPDQRQIRNIRNEFAMYRDRLLQPGRYPDELDADRLLALILYKNLEVADFERIRLGKSKLHDILRLSQALINENLAHVSVRLNHPSEESQGARAKDLAQHLVMRGDAIGIQFQRVVRNRPYSDSYVTLSEQELSDLALWRQIAAGANLNYNDGRSLSRNAIETGFDVSLSFAEATAVPLSDVEREQLESDRAALETANWVRLWEAPEFVLGAGSTAWSENERTSDSLSVAQIVERKMGEGLASDLIAAGYLTQNFALLSAHFDVEFLGVEAQNFITAVTERPGRRMLAPVLPGAIQEILAEHGAQILERSGMVNIHVLEYVLANVPEEALRIIAQLRSWNADDESFVRAFFSRYGSDSAPLPLADAVGYLTSLAPSSVSFFATDSSIPDERRAQVFDAAIGGVRAGQFPAALSEAAAVRRYAQQVHSSLDSLTGSDRPATAAANCLIQLGVTVNNLGPLSVAVRNMFVKQGLFDITTSNLSVIVGDEQPRWVSLERLKAGTDAYHATVPRIDEYLALVLDQGDAADVVTAESADGLAGILEDLAAGDETSIRADGVLRTVARRADSTIKVNDFKENSRTVQEALLLENRALISTSNLIARLNSEGTITEGIATALHRNALPEHADLADLSPFLTAVLLATRAYPELLTADVVSTLLTHLHGHFEIDAATLLAAEPLVATRLISDGWGELDELRAAADTELDWSIREVLLSAKPAPELAEAEQISGPEDVVRLLGSRTIEHEVKAYVRFQLDALLVEPQAKRNADVIASFLQEQEIGVDLDGIHRLARASANRSPLLALVSMSSVREEVAAAPATTLSILGGKYAAIVSREVRQSPTFAPTKENRDFLALLVDLGLIRMRKPRQDGTLQITRLGRS